MSKQNYPVNATENVLDIIEYLSEVEEAGVTEIADSIELSKSAVYNQLQTLKSWGYVRQECTEYGLGYGFLRHSGRIKRRSQLVQAADDTIRDLADTTEETISLVIPQEEHAVYLQTAGNASERMPVEEGEFKPLPASPSGQAILTYLPEEQQKDILSLWNKEISLDHVRVESMQKRQIVFCGTEQNNWLAVAAPVLSLEDDPIGAVEVMGLESELSGRTAEVEIPGLLQNSIQSLENNFPVDQELGK